MPGVAVAGVGEEARCGDGAEPDGSAVQAVRARQAAVMTGTVAKVRRMFLPEAM